MSEKNGGRKTIKKEDINATGQLPDINKAKLNETPKVFSFVTKKKKKISIKFKTRTKDFLKKDFA